MKYKIVPYIQQESKDIERISKYAYILYAYLDILSISLDSC